MSLKRLVPLLDRVLVEKIAPPAKSVGGVLLPESAVQKVRPCALWEAGWFINSTGSRAQGASSSCCWGSAALVSSNASAIQTAQCRWRATTLAAPPAPAPAD